MDLLAFWNDILHAAYVITTYLIALVGVAAIAGIIGLIGALAWAVHDSEK